MNTKSKVVISGMVAAVAAIALILSASVLLPASTYSQSGTLSVLLTDPPTVPTGTSAVYITYSNLQVHVSGDGNQSGWITLGSSGTINLMGVENFSQTIASASIQKGTFNALRFNITNVLVTYNGVNYTADTVYGHNAFFVAIPGGISVQGAQTSAALIDLAPKILLLGTPQNPTFAFLPSGRAFVIPSAQIPAEAHHIGGRYNLSKSQWYASFMAGTKFGVTGVELSANSFNMTVTNTGSASVVFRLAAVTTQNSISGGASMFLPTSEVFVVEPNATMVAITGGTNAQIYQEIASGGYLLIPGQSVTFTYSGAVQIGALNFVGMQVQSVVSGQLYHTALYGNTMIAQAGVVAA